MPPLVTIVAFTLQLLHSRAEKEWNEAVAALKTAGVDPAAAARPPLPPEEKNFAALPLLRRLMSEDTTGRTGSVSDKWEEAARAISESVSALHRAEDSASPPEDPDRMFVEDLAENLAKVFPDELERAGEEKRITENSAPAEIAELLLSGLPGTQILLTEVTRRTEAVVPPPDPHDPFCAQLPGYKWDWPEQTVKYNIMCLVRPARVMRVRAELGLLRGDTARAVQFLEINSRLARAVESVGEPFDLCFAALIDAENCGVIEKGCSKGRWKSSDTAALRALLDTPPPEARLREAMARSVRTAGQWAEWAAQSPRRYLEQQSRTMRISRELEQEMRPRVGDSAKVFLDMAEALAPAALTRLSARFGRPVSTSQFQEAAARARRLHEIYIPALNDGGIVRWLKLTGPELSDFDAVERRCAMELMKSRTHRCLAITGLALYERRYERRQRTGAYPESLNDPELRRLAGDALNDPWTGQLLRYERAGAGTFRLWSVGPDGKDDGGTPEGENPFAPPDIVWKGGAPDRKP